ncbi:MAG: cyclic nucleotide-binding domain-containing protein [Myxococcales bacterium]|nr:cyclic nucleotide-binding domain-containing protein [Myxococcales bacterium]
MELRKLKDKAAEAFSKGRFAKAAELYEDYCKEDAKDHQARVRMGDAFAKSGNRDRAILAYKAAAEGYAREGFLPRAIAASKLVLELDASHKGVQQMLAQLYARKAGPADGKPKAAAAAELTAAAGTPKREAIELPAGGGALELLSDRKDSRSPSPMNRKDAIELAQHDARSAPEARAERPSGPPAPSPMNRKDAIELPPDDAGAVIELRGDRDSGPPAPSPMNRKDAIELPPDDAGAVIELRGDRDSRAPAPSPMNRKDAIELPPDDSPAPAGAPIEIEIDSSPRKPGEIEVVIEAPASPNELSLEAVRGKALDLSAELPPELQLEPAPGTPPAEEPALPSVIVDPALLIPPASVGAAPAEGSAPPGLKPKRIHEAARVEAARAAAPGGPPPPLEEPSLPRAEPAARALEATPDSPPAATQEAIGRPPPPPPAAPVQSRIWLPPALAASAQGQEPAAEAPAAPPQPASAKKFKSDIEAGLAAFNRFEEIEIEIEVAAVPAPAVSPPAASAPTALPPSAPASPLDAARGRRISTFTELELEGDSLLHAVDTAAQQGIAQRGQQPVDDAEEAMEAPEELSAERREAGELPKIPLFSDLPPDAFIELFERCPLRRFDEGERVVEEGSLGDSFFVICAGSVRVYRYHDGEKRELAVLPESSFFGEMALLSGAPRTASVEAASPETQLLEISAPVLAQLSHRYPQVSQALKKFCRQRMLSNVMRSSALFQPFNRDDRRDLIQKFRARDVRKAQVVIREGEQTDGLYVVLSGEVEVKKTGQRLALLREGDIFGEMSLLKKTAATATVAALKHTSLLRLPRADFDELIMSHPQILALVADLTEDRRRQTEAVLEGKAIAGEEGLLLV